MHLSEGLQLAYVRLQIILWLRNANLCLLNKSLYGLKQASRTWYIRFATYITSLGFVDVKSDTSLFVFRCGSDTVYLLLYVDDIALTASSAALLQQIISTLKRKFAMKDLRPLYHFLGVCTTLG
jgi:hypothetical protein